MVFLAVADGAGCKSCLPFFRHRTDGHLLGLSLTVLLLYPSRYMGS